MNKTAEVDSIYCSHPSWIISNCWVRSKKTAKSFWECALEIIIFQYAYEILSECVLCQLYSPIEINHLLMFSTNSSFFPQLRILSVLQFLLTAFLRWWFITSSWKQPTWRPDPFTLTTVPQSIYTDTAKTVVDFMKTNPCNKPPSWLMVAVTGLNGDGSFPLRFDSWSFENWVAKRCYFLPKSIHPLEAPFGKGCGALIFC